MNLQVREEVRDLLRLDMTDDVPDEVTGESRIRGCFFGIWGWDGPPNIKSP